MYLLSKKLKKLVFVSYKLTPYLSRKLLNTINSIVYRLCFSNCGRNVLIEYGVKISNPWNVSVGDNVRIIRGSVITTEFPDATLTIMDNVEINTSSFIDYSGNLTIGNNTTISAKVTVYSHSHGLNPRYEPIPIPKIIGDNVWLGYNSFIGEGCESIHADSVIGARSTVTKNITARSVVVGNNRIITK